MRRAEELEPGTVNRVVIPEVFDSGMLGKWCRPHIFSLEGRHFYLFKYTFEIINLNLYGPNSSLIYTLLWNCTSHNQGRIWPSECLFSHSAHSLHWLVVRINVCAGLWRCKIYNIPRRMENWVHPAGIETHGHSNDCGNIMSSLNTKSSSLFEHGLNDPT